MKASKTDIVKEYVAKGNLTKAIQLAASFRIGFTKEEKRIMEIAKDVIAGRGKFYAQLGIDVEAVSIQAQAIVKAKF